ncbi:Clavaminate synthase-like protein [Sanghuangporus baumii]|uniref:Clavaminate synthase-like protein n=1 Tax=Sanghuangporus baumii TaxID=108892 RepID=A0A9Q5N3K8_SANBA|nr:Clavaminate synthase-like protein [Sanghuangporus baumii]
MFTSDSLSHPSRGLRVNINDLLNPVCPSDAERSSPPNEHRVSVASSSINKVHTPVLPGISTLGKPPHEPQSNGRSDAQRISSSKASIVSFSEVDSWLTDGIQYKSQEQAGRTLENTQDGQSHFSLRSAQWTPTHAHNGNLRPALPPLRDVHDLKAEPRQTSRFLLSPQERQYGGDAEPESPRSSHLGMNRPMHRASVTLPSPISPTSPQEIPRVPGFVSHPNAAPTMMAIPRSPYGYYERRPQQANYPTSPGVLGPHDYGHHHHPHHHLGGRLPLVRSIHSPVTLSPTSAKNEYNATDTVLALSDSPTAMTAVEGPIASFQPAERPSVRLVGSTTPTQASVPNDPAQVLQLHPTDYPQHPRKRTHSNAGLNRQTGDSVASEYGAREDEEASKAKKARGKRSVATSSTSGAASKKDGKSSRKHSGSDDNASETAGSQKASRKGKQKEKPTASPSHGHTNGHLQPYDPQMTMSLGYGVGVVPVREGVPMYPFGYSPFPVPMHMHPLGVPVAVAAAQNQPFGGKWFPELQYARCMSARYKADPFPRCVSCTRRWAGDTCRFQNIRILLRDSNKVLWAVGFQDLGAKVQGPHMVYPDSWNVPLEKRHIDRVMSTVAMSLVTHLRKEQAHQSLGSVVRRQRETDVRATCDTCMTSLFSSSWMCRQCGREACEECYETIRRLTEHSGAPNSPLEGRSKGPGSPTDQRTMKERHAQANPFFLSCNRKAEHGVHTFVPVTRFSKPELDNAVAEMKVLVRQGHGHRSPCQSRRASDATSMEVDLSQASSSSAGSRGTEIKQPYGESIQITSANPATLIPEHYNDGICTLVENPIPPPRGESSSHIPPSSRTPLGTPAWPVPYYTAETLTELVFAAQWARGTPLVVTGLLDRLKLSWSPEYFINTYGAQQCIVLECQTDANKKVTVGEFFSSFGKYNDRKDCWKLKDWPPSTDFKTAFPELYDDFNRAVPVPSYTRRDGAYNIASHFPSNTIAPDLGPKMYNAYASSDTEGSKGTTRLHMDMADAVNIMLHAEPTPDGAPGCAAWDIFRAEDSVHLRSFFKKNFKGRYQNDPIHAQQFYLDPPLRARLFEEYGVRSFRIYQRPGEAVFIPAGCAHQVCNLSDSIKAACDFVSPENVERCETLTREFRQQNQSLVWKEDVLQLRSMMWFAWLSCRQQQEKAKQQDSGLESAVAQATISGDDKDEMDADTVLTHLTRKNADGSSLGPILTADVGGCPIYNEDAYLRDELRFLQGRQALTTYAAKQCRVSWNEANVGLSVELPLLITEEYSQNPNWNQAVHMLMVHKHQWKELTVDLATIHKELQITEDEDERFQWAHYLVDYDRDDDASPEFYSGWQFPSLKTLVSEVHIPPPGKLPNLTEFTLDLSIREAPEPKIILDALAHFLNSQPSLKTFQLIVGVYTYAIMGRDTINLPELRALHIENRYAHRESVRSLRSVSRALLIPEVRSISLSVG